VKPIAGYKTLPHYPALVHPEKPHPRFHASRGADIALFSRRRWCNGKIVVVCTTFLHVNNKYILFTGFSSDQLNIARV
jgi:hypothetical protein